MMKVIKLPPGTPVKIAYIAMNGDDATAELDNMEKPFLSMVPIMEILKEQSEKLEFILEIKNIGYLPQPRAATPLPVP